MSVTTMPFGKHKGQPLADVPSSYLRWLAGEKLSSGLRLAVAEELRRRGLEPPPPPPPPREVRCPDCPGAPLYCTWLEDSAGRKRVRAECAACGRYLGHPPCVPPYSTMADRAASGTDVLDVLTELEALGVEPQSDGKKTWLRWEDERRVPQPLKGLLRSCSYRLARLLGRTRSTTP